MRDEWATALQHALKEELPQGWRESAPWGYPQQGELAIIAGVFAAQLPQSTAEEVAASFMMARPGRMLDDLAQLAELTDDELAALLGPSWGTSRVLGVPRRRAAVIVDAAQELVSVGVRSAQEYREAVAGDGRAVDAALRRVRGLGGVSSEAISTMMQAEHRPGPVVIAHLRHLLGDEGASLGDDDVMPLLRATARRLTVQPRALLYALWRVVDVPEVSEAPYTPRSAGSGVSSGPV